VTIKWQTPARCTNDQPFCVGVAALPTGEVVIANTRAPGYLAFTPEEMKLFIEAVKAGEYDSYV
jgi:hypothetical protein